MQTLQCFMREPGTVFSAKYECRYTIVSGPVSTPSLVSTVVKKMGSIIRSSCFGCMLLALILQGK